jgi:N-acetylglucosamine kinase-like BadF-type ATPase
MALVAGVDGGASSTKAIVYDPESGGAWTGRAGPANPVNVGAATAALNIRAAVEDALRGTGYRLRDVASIAAGLAGLDSRLLAAQLVPHIVSSSGLGGRLLVEHDAHVAWLHAGRGSNVVLVIAGTGSIAYNAYGGRRVIVGNHGWLLGDEGSGFWVGRAALRRLLKALDGRAGMDCLAKKLMERLGVRDGDQLAYWFYLTRGRVERIASIARHVAEIAEQGCGPAAELLETGARLLAEAARTAAEKTAADKVYTTGSMFSSRIYTSAFTEALQERGLGVASRPVYPALGALYLALRRAGYSDEAWSHVDSPKLLEAAEALYRSGLGQEGGL